MVAAAAPPLPPTLLPFALAALEWRGEPSSTRAVSGCRDAGTQLGQRAHLPQRGELLGDLLHLGLRVHLEAQDVAAAAGQGLPGSADTGCRQQ